MHKRQKTKMLAESERAPRWILVDAKGKVLGRLASEIAKVLRGKHKPTYTEHIDSGDGVIVINAEQVAVSGAKRAQKIYRHYSGYTQGLKEIPYKVMMDKKPTYVLEHAVKGMVPRTKLGRSQMKRLRIFAGAEHTMESQKPLQAQI
jgi:large subunit ribosomal protein L13